MTTLENGLARVKGKGRGGGMKPRHTSVSGRRSGALVQALEGEIRRGRFASGDRLPSEAELGAEFGVSRTVVREALGALKARGMLVSRRGSGTYVAEPDHASIRSSIAWFAEMERDAGRFLEMMDLRLQIETFCARRLADSGGGLQEVRQRLKEMESAGADLGKFADADIAFHLALIEASGHRLFVEVAGAVLPVLGKRFARTTHRDVRTARRVLREHRAIFKALRSGDADTAEAAMRSHLETSRGQFLEALSRSSRVGPPAKPPAV